MFNSVEFYVILAVLAAAVVALASRPTSIGPVTEHLLAGILRGSNLEEPGLDITCRSDGSVCIQRTGVDGLAENGAVSLAVKKKGQDLSIEERVTIGRGEPRGLTEAIFNIDFLPPGRYHVNYNSSDTGLFCVFTLSVIPGLQTRKLLHD